MKKFRVFIQSEMRFSYTVFVYYFIIISIEKNCILRLFISVCHFTFQRRCRSDHPVRVRNVFSLYRERLRHRDRRRLGQIRRLLLRRHRDGVDSFVFLSDAPFSAIWHGDFETKPEMNSMFVNLELFRNKNKKNENVFSICTALF